MRNIRLYVNGSPLVIELGEDEPEIRRESEPRSSRDRRMTVYPFSDDEKLARVAIDLRVEAM